MCKLLKVSRSGYYRFKTNPQSTLEKRVAETREQIKKVYFDCKGLYGSPRISAELASKGIVISRTTVAKHLNNMNLKSKRTPKFKITTDSNHKEPICDNILNRSFSPNAPSKAWVSDITYIQTITGFIYLTVIIDLFDRKVIGWSISSGMSAQETVVKALHMAIKNRKPLKGLIFHSDRGVQYAAGVTRNILAFYQITQSMSRKGNCWDNAPAESFFKSLKSEIIYGYKLKDKGQMKLGLFRYIEIWYNKKRRHSFLRNLTIEEFWMKINNNKYKYSTGA